MKSQKPDPMFNDEPNGKPVTFKQIVSVTLVLVAALAACLIVAGFLFPDITSQASASIPALNFR